MEIKPIGARIVVEQTEAQKNVGGIIIPDIMAGNTNRGVVVAVGEKVEETHVGDVVILEPFKSQELELEGKKYLIINEANVIAVVSE